MQVGLDRFLRTGPGAYGRVGWLANGAAVTTEGLVWGPAAALAEGFPVSLLFTPEHGPHGAVKEGERVSHGSDDVTGLPYHSMYGGSPEGTPDGALVEAISQCDTVVVDLPDLGARYSTYIATTKQLVDAAARAGRRVVVLDRPNLLGRRREGPGLAPGRASFVGALPVPIRHGLTLGEMMRWYTRTRQVDVDLDVVAIDGWEAAAAGLGYAPYLPPSPNMNCVAAQFLYPGTCLVEGTNLSEGRGTANPFQVVGAPWLDTAAVLKRLRADAWPGVLFREVHFVPLVQKHAGSVCRGIFFHVVEPDGLRPVELGVRLLSLVFATSPEARLQRPAGGGAGHLGHLGQLWGSDDLGHHLEEGGANKGEFDVLTAAGFEKEVAPDLLYG